MILESLFLAAALTAFCSLFAACGGDDDDDDSGGDTGDTGSAATSGSGATGEKNADGQSVSGEVQLSGKLAGTFKWNKDLAVTYCSPLRVAFTMTDGKDAFIALESLNLNDGTDESSVSSAKASGRFIAKSVPINAKQTANFGAVGSVTWSNVEMKNQAGDTVTVNGTLKFDCP